MQKYVRAVLFPQHGFYTCWLFFLTRVFKKPHEFVCSNDLCRSLSLQEILKIKLFQCLHLAVSSMILVSITLLILHLMSPENISIFVFLGPFSDGLRDMTVYVKDIRKGLREFKNSSTVACEMLQIFYEGSDYSVVSYQFLGHICKHIILQNNKDCSLWHQELWNHQELAQEDCSTNGAVLSIVCRKDKIFTGHSDGTIKVRLFLLTILIRNARKANSIIFH